MICMNPFHCYSIWNGTGPWNPNLDPIVINEAFETALHEMTTLTGFGMPGVWTWGFGEGWGHHYLDSLAMNHNALGRGYETFGNSTAETVARVLRPNQERYVDKPVTERGLVSSVAARQEDELVVAQ